jgi:hypothetical protein
MSFAPDTEPFAKPETLLRVPVGLASPLWGLFAGAAMTGATWWWMTRWARPQNLEAIFGAAEKFEAAVAPEAAKPMAETAPEAVAEPVVEATPEPVKEAVAEATPAQIVEAVIEAPSAPEPVGGESAPISPVLEAVAPPATELVTAAETTPEPKPKKKPTEPKSA